VTPRNLGNNGSGAVGFYNFRARNLSKARVTRYSLAAMTFTRESLLAEWQAISSSHPLITEVQDILLMFINTPQLDDVSIEDVTSTSRLIDIVDEPIPPPQRFHRQRSHARRGCKVPTGPSVAEDSSCLKNVRGEAEGVKDLVFQVPPSGAGSVGDDNLHADFDDIEPANDAEQGN
jgi:hypothetical protein